MEVEKSSKTTDSPSTTKYLEGGARGKVMGWSLSLLVAVSMGHLKKQTNKNYPDQRREMSQSPWEDVAATIMMEQEWKQIANSLNAGCYLQNSR